MTLGHEISGVVEAIGGTDERIELGARVAIDPCLRCGVCRWCTRGEYHICPKGGSIGLAADGGLAALVTVPVEQLVAVPDNVSDQVAAMAEPLAVGLHAVRRSGVALGDNVLILGAGPIGIAVLMFAKLAGAGAIFVSEPLGERAEWARALGATEVFNPDSDDVRREVFLRTGRVGPDTVIEATGHKDAANLGINSVRRGGVAALAGVSGDHLDVPLGSVVYFERTVIGSLGYNFDIQRVLDLVSNGRLDPSPLLTDVYPLSQAEEVFELLRTRPGEHLKILLEPGG